MATKNREILQILATYDMKISLAHLKRVKSKLRLNRRDFKVEEVIAAILMELETGGRCLDYRSMTERLRLSHGLHAHPHPV